MDLQRFTFLSETYGARIARWPAVEQAEARAMAAADPSAAAIIERQDTFDAVLDEWRIDPADAALRRAVLANTTTSRTLSYAKRADRARDLRLWFAGAGLAAALAGVFCGALVSTLAVGEARDEALVASAVSDSAVSDQT